MAGNLTLPCASPETAHNGCMANAETTRKFSLRGESLRVFPPNRFRGFVGKFSIPSLHCWCKRGLFPAPLGVPVGRIVGWGSKPKMARINAGRIIAAMKYPKPFWDRAIVNNPRRSSGVYHSSGLCAPANVPVPFSYGTSPKPAIVRFVNLLPESFKEIARKVLCCKNWIWMKIPDSALAWLKTICNLAHVLVSPRMDYESCAAFSLSTTIQALQETFGGGDYRSRVTLDSAPVFPN